MKFPKILEHAKLSISKSRVLFHSSDLERSDLTQYMSWKAALGVDVLTPAVLRSLYARGLFKTEISNLFKKNKEHAYLGTVLKRKRTFKSTPVNSGTYSA